MRRLRIALCAALILVVIGLAFAAYHQFAPRRAPPGQPPLTPLTPQELLALRESFNKADDATRVLVLLSPT